VLDLTGLFAPRGKEALPTRRQTGCLAPGFSIQTNREYPGTFKFGRKKMTFSLMTVIFCDDDDFS
jgi:hypothetical protein